MPYGILANIGSGNGLSPVRCKPTTGTYADSLTIEPLWTNSTKAWIKILQFSFRKRYYKMSASVSLLVPTSVLTHWGRVTHICVGKLIIIGSDNGLSPDRRQAIIWTNAGLLSIGPLQTYFSENLIKMQQFSLKKMHVKMLSAKWRLSCLGLNVLTLLVLFQDY